MCASAERRFRSLQWKYSPGHEINRRRFDSPDYVAVFSPVAVAPNKSHFQFQGGERFAARFVNANFAVGHCFG